MNASLVIVGAGPAGLRAAEVALEAGISVSLFDAMPSPGRKFLIAGRGGLNLTNTASQFVEKYLGEDMPPDLWENLLRDFSPSDLCAWAKSLGIETFVASSGRVYPKEMKSAPLLRRWLSRLRAQDFTFFPRHRWVGMRQVLGTAGGGSWELDFETPTGATTVETKAVVFALGGGSWPQTGSTGAWQEIFQKYGIAVSPLISANCGWEYEQTGWQELAGKPLKNLRASAGGRSAIGELLITDYGFEGGLLYTLTPELRKSPWLFLDLKPDFTQEELNSRMPAKERFHLHEAFERCRIQVTARHLLKNHPNAADWHTPQAFAAAIKALPLEMLRPRPLAEAISSAGGVRWGEMDEELMVAQHPGVFLAGEMLDWEAPTGGYLLQGCFSTGTKAGKSAAKFLHRESSK